MTDPDPVYGLVCAGGGAHGAYQVGVLKYLHEHFCNGDASPFQIFCGTSAGSLNTCFVASRSYDARTARLELEELWMGFHVPQYYGNILDEHVEVVRQGDHEIQEGQETLLVAAGSRAARGCRTPGFRSGDF